MKTTQQRSVKGSYSGMNSKVGDLLVNRLLPGSEVRAVGPFVFLDHLYPTEQKAKIPTLPSGKFAHPHRGIATFSYIFSGSLEHFDSHGGHGIVEAGGAQWMKAGNGVVHDEHSSPEFQRTGGILHSLQFWINLPAKNKAEAPDYLALHPSDIPEIELPDHAGTLRVVIGNIGEKQSPVKTYSEQFLYHIILQPKSKFTFAVPAQQEAAAFVPLNEVTINGSDFGKSEVVFFRNEEGEIELINKNTSAVDLILFGGEQYAELIIAEGPFVMNSRNEIAQAYKDFFDGKYGEIDYNRLSGQV
jgi:redox-sensitive bicupin YhaK (pirin superfamily)